MGSVDRVTSFVSSFVMALNRQSVEAVKTTIVLHVGNDWSEQHMEQWLS